MSSSSVEQIKEKLDIAEVIGGYIKLEKAGGSFKGKCPFHNEKTPSFFVSPARGSYYCFGCGAKGDMFTFVQEFEGLDFVGALKMLAERAGVILEDFPRRDNSERETLYRILEEATVFFEKGLADAPNAKKYLLGRGLQEDTIASWRIGYVPKDWRLLHTYLKGKGIAEREMEKAGLIKRSEKGEGDLGWYDVFRGRIMFPIYDGSGWVIAFSGRLLEDDEKAPKYLNSPETMLFNKSETLYGLDRAKLEIRKRDYTILVEGQLDILMCHQGGFPNTVASSGTAFTREHLLKLQRLSNRITLAFDADKAGFTAANKSAVLALSLGMEVKIVDMPKGTDPAELVKNDIEAWKDALRNGKHLIDFYLDNLAATISDKRTLVKQVEKKVLPYIAMLASAIEQSHFVSQVSKRTGIREEAIWNDLRRVPRGIPEESKESQGKVVEVEVKRRKNYIEHKLVGIVFWQEAKEEHTIDPVNLRIRLVATAGDKYVANLFKTLEVDKEELIFQAEAYYEANDMLVKDVEELLYNFEEDVLRESFVKAMAELETAEKSKDEAKSKELLEQCQSIGVKLSELSKRRLGQGT